MSAPYIDIRRPGRSYRATCPECGMQRELPDNWQAIMRECLPPGEAQTWDGKLCCRNGHHDAEMLLAEQWHTPREPDGSVIVHLAGDRQRHLTACSGEPNYPPGPDVAAGTMLRQCPACFHLARSGPPVLSAITERYQSSSAT